MYRDNANAESKTPNNRTAKQRKYGKLLSEHPYLYLVIFSYFSFSGGLNLIRGVLAIFFVALNIAGNEFVKTSTFNIIGTMIYALILAPIGIRGICKFVQYKKDPDVIAKKERDKAGNNTLNQTQAPLSSRSAASPMAAPAPSAPAPEKRPNILQRYTKALEYLDSCDTFDEAQLRETNRLTGNQFAEADIQKFLAQSKMIIGGMNEIRKAIRDALQEGIAAFKAAEAQGIDLDQFDV